MMLFSTIISPLNTAQLKVTNLLDSWIFLNEHREMINSWQYRPIYKGALSFKKIYKKINQIEKMFRKTHNKKKTLKLLKEHVDKGLAPPKDNYQMRQKSSHQQALIVPQPTISIQQNIKTQIDKDVDKQNTAVSSNMQEISVNDKEGNKYYSRNSENFEFCQDVSEIKSNSSFGNNLIEDSQFIQQQWIQLLKQSETHAYCQEKDVGRQITESCQDLSEIKSNSSFGNNLSEDDQFIQRWILFNQSSQPLSIRSIASQLMGTKSYYISKNQCSCQLMKGDLEDNYGTGYIPDDKKGEFWIGNKKISYLKVDVREDKITQFEKLYPQGTVSEQGYKTYELKQEIPCSQMGYAKLDENIRKQFDGICNVTEQSITILNMELACDVYCTLDQINFWPEQKMLTTTHK